LVPGAETYQPDDRGVKPANSLPLRAKSERATLYTEIQLASLRGKICTLETAEKKRQKVLIQSAVEKLVASGAIHRHNIYGQFNVLEQLARDPLVCPS
jgi:hypothetical protein